MPGDAAGQLSWHLSGGVANNQPDLSLGGVRSNQQIRRNTTTVSTAAVAGDVRINLASVVSACGEGLIYFRDGASGGFLSRVTAISVGTPGWVDLLDPLTAAAAIGDQVWFYRHTTGTMPYNGETTALECALGFTHYIGLYATNSGGALGDFRFYLEAELPGPYVHEIAASNTTAHTLNTIPNKETAPDLSGMLAGGGSGRWSRAREGAPNPGAFSFGAGSVGFWLKRTGLANAVRQTDLAFSIVGHDPTAGVLSKLVLHWNAAGFTPVLTLTHAPTVYLRGGARFKAKVVGQETGLVVPDVPASIVQTAGPGTLSPPPAPQETDEQGELLARYAAPVDVGEIDNTFTVEARV